MCTPNDYLTLIDSLLLHYRRQANLDLHHHQNEATPCFQQTYFYFVKKVILLLFDLLQKPIHPQHGACNAWDLSAEEIIHTKADVIKKLWLASFSKSHKRQQEEANWNDESGADVLHFVLFDVLHLHRRHEITTTDRHKAELYLSVLYELVMERLVLLESGKGKIQRSKLIYTFEKEHDHLPQHCSAPAREWESERMVLHPLFFTGLLSVCLQIPSHTGDDRGFKQNVILLLQQAAQCCLYPLLPVSETANTQDTSPPKDGDSLFTEGIIFEAAETAALCGDAETVTRLLFLLYQSRGLLYSSSVLLAERGGDTAG
ncbi:hypothetical protein ADEAN_000181900 [Angomonas deanei]|uniref:Uncharacterized protein n=1 Tax=Angomonas deanei TaxID=59799 RepID=A0A7G2C5E0_9TRYP|nr:hypothetical protein ADEAN_000181900 [Angomonas deanei]